VALSLRDVGFTIAHVPDNGLPGIINDTLHFLNDALLFVAAYLALKGPGEVADRRPSFVSSAAAICGTGAAVILIVDAFLPIRLSGGGTKAAFTTGMGAVSMLSQVLLSFIHPVVILVGLWLLMRGRPRAAAGVFLLALELRTIGLVWVGILESTIHVDTGIGFALDILAIGLAMLAFFSAMRESRPNLASESPIPPNPLRVFPPSR
jgi:hypothetical protein